MNIKGTVEAISEKGTRYGLKIGEEWYNGFGTCEVKKDDIVDLDFKELTKNGTLFRNIAKINSIRTGAPDEAHPETPAPANKQLRSATLITEVEIVDEVNFLADLYERFVVKAEIAQRPVSDLATAELACQAYRFLRFGKFNKK